MLIQWRNPGKRGESGASCPTILMALFENKKKYEVIRESEDVTLRIDYDNLSHIPSIEDNEEVMSLAVDAIVDVGDVTKIVFYQKRDYEYDYAQTKLIVEMAQLYKKLIKQKDLFKITSMVSENRAFTTFYSQRYVELQNLVFRKLKEDPITTYVQLKRIFRREEIDREENKQRSHDEKYFTLLRYIISMMDKTKLISIVKPFLEGFKPGDRELYRRIFSPSIKPDFMFTKLMADYPLEGEEIDSYMIKDETEVTIFKVPETVQYLYHLLPPEFKLDEEQYEILDIARRIMAEHKPTKSEFVNPERMREVFFNIGHDLIEELIGYRNVKMTEKEISKLTRILVRYTVGFGLIEVLLSDEKIQDVSINSPAGNIPMFIVHADYDDCKTNVVPTSREVDSWATKLRLMSGRPLDEANPILDTELELPGASTRVSAVTRPLDPSGLAFSFRRHRDKPWTLPLFIKAKMITPFAAGLISFLVDGTRTLLIAGTRSSGKSSLLSAILVEIMRKYRIITIEDTLELPTSHLRRMGYNIQPLQVASSLTKTSTEMTASEGIRSTLRLGDSALIVGEVRSEEARALYEAMRVGAAANTVAGTIHGDSPYGIYDRVVNDIGVPSTSFKATDVIIVANPIRSADGLHKFRRVTSITEVRKDWVNDPLLEHGFTDLMKYDPKDDELKISPELKNGESEILKTIASNIKDYSNNWDAIWENIELRAKIKLAQVEMAEKTGDQDILEARFTVLCNDYFHKISDQVKEELGVLDAKRIFFEWNEWLKSTVKKNKHKEAGE
ncbi:type II/IV secretion system ATPase subunit [Candidatus Woesearchaeota archaeon]|nr:type II/IV secretion system ATPase subunit [Candidatus Woesearchaeota archaeon]